MFHSKSVRESHRAQLMVILVFAVSAMMIGCQTEETDDDEHHTHHHKPRSFSVAFDRLVELHQQIRHEASHDGGDDHDHDDPDEHEHDHAEEHGHDHADEHDHADGHDHADSHSDQDRYEESLDIARWLPDLAAESDLDESAWNQTNRVAGRLETILKQVCSDDGDRRRKAYLNEISKIEDCHRELAKSNRLMMELDPAHRNEP